MARCRGAACRARVAYRGWAGQALPLRGRGPLKSNRPALQKGERSGGSLCRSVPLLLSASTTSADTASHEVSAPDEVAVSKCGSCEESTRGGRRGNLPGTGSRKTGLLPDRQGQRVRNRLVRLIPRWISAGAVLRS